MICTFNIVSKFKIQKCIHLLISRANKNISAIHTTSYLFIEYEHIIKQTHHVTKALSKPVT